MLYIYTHFFVYYTMTWRSKSFLFQRTIIYINLEESIISVQKSSDKFCLRLSYPTAAKLKTVISQKRVFFSRTRLHHLIHPSIWSSSKIREPLITKTSNPSISFVQNEAWIVSTAAIFNDGCLESMTRDLEMISMCNPP